MLARGLNPQPKNLRLKKSFYVLRNGQSGIPVLGCSEPLGDGGTPEPLLGSQLSESVSIRKYKSSFDFKKIIDYNLS